MLILASASPRRAELLTAAGMAFEVHPAHLDEHALPGEDAEMHVRRLAGSKARAVSGLHPGRPVLAADTVVVVDGRLLGKPEDAEDARRMLRLLSGRAHQVLTAVTLVSGRSSESGPETPDTEVARTHVEFAPLEAAEIDAYVATGEGLDKAGAYAVQGRASRFVTRIDGSYSNVVGLPVALVYQMCTRAGLLLS